MFCHHSAPNFEWSDNIVKLIPEENKSGDITYWAAEAAASLTKQIILVRLFSHVTEV